MDIRFLINDNILVELNTETERCLSSKPIDTIEEIESIKIYHDYSFKLEELSTRLHQCIYKDIIESYFKYNGGDRISQESQYYTIYSSIDIIPTEANNYISFIADKLLAVLKFSEFHTRYKKISSDFCYDNKSNGILFPISEDIYNSFAHLENLVIDTDSYDNLWERWYYASYSVENYSEITNYLDGLTKKEI